VAAYHKALRVTIGILLLSVVGEPLTGVVYSENLKVKIVSRDLKDEANSFKQEEPC